MRANTNLDLNEKEELCRKFFKDVGDELVTGKIAYLEIEGPGSESITLEVSRFD